MSPLDKMNFQNILQMLVSGQTHYPHVDGAGVWKVKKTQCLLGLPNYLLEFFLLDPSILPTSGKCWMIVWQPFSSLKLMRVILNHLCSTNHSCNFGLHLDQWKTWKTIIFGNFTVIFVQIDHVSLWLQGLTPTFSLIR